MNPSLRVVSRTDQAEWDRRFIRVAREERRAGPPYGPVACSWRYGWEYRDGLCAVARGEAGDNPITEPPSEVAPC